ncbi:MAG: hypothetical protein OXI23_19155, partial [Gemmatimonadota bacterium]|nr:hypothetical protein [Gemmatimonadota bacterium]
MNQPLLIEPETVVVDRSPTPIPRPTILTIYYRTSDGALSAVAFGLSTHQADKLESDLRLKRGEAPTSGT